MSFPDPLTFFKQMGVMMLIILLVGGLLYWLFKLLNKIAPDFKYWFKYNVLKRPYVERDVELLIEYDQQNKSVDEVNKILLVNNIPLGKTKDMLFVYKQIRVKGGKKNE